MSKTIIRVRAREAKQVAARQPAVMREHSSTKTDLVLQRLANASQLALVVLAIFGYFFTVLPIYQKSLLDEEIAKKTLELRTMEGRITQAEALLAAREAEVSSMTKRIKEVKAVADAARQGLGLAQAEVGKLRGAVETRYLQLLPRILRDFQSLALNQCNGRDSTKALFADCVERNVLTSPSLSGLESPDKSRLLSIVKRRSSTIDGLTSEFSRKIADRRQTADFQAQEAHARCEQFKASDDYKDRMKRPAVDYRCNTEANRVTVERLNIQIDELILGDKVLVPHIADIVKEFFASRYRDGLE